MSHLTRQQVESFLSDELEADDFDAVCDHLELCSQCSERCTRSALKSGLRSRFRRWATPRVVFVSLVILAFATGFAGAEILEHFSQKIILVTSSGSRGTRVAEFGLRTGLKFDAASVPDEAKVLEWASFVVPNKGIGTAVLVEMPLRRRMDLCGFDADGSLKWSARRDWVDWSETLGKERLGFLSMKSLVTTRRQRETAETLVLVVQRDFQCLILMVDPLTGVERGRCFYPGTVGKGTDEVVGTLPDPSVNRRHLVLVGQVGDAESARPSVLVLSLDGSVVQHLVFPLVGVLDPYGVRIARVHTDWSPDRPELTVNTTEAAFFSFLIRDRRLDSKSLIAAIGGGAAGAYDRRHGDGAWNRLLEARGGLIVFQRDLASQVEERPFEVVRTWRNR